MLYWMAPRSKFRTPDRAACVPVAFWCRAARVYDTISQDADSLGGNLFQPTVLSEMPDDAVIFQEETSGPPLLFRGP